MGEAQRGKNSKRSATAEDRLVGENVRALRTEAGLTLTALGAELGISHQQLQKYETADNRISAGMLASIASIFKVPIDDLFLSVAAGPKSNLSNLDRARARCRRIVNSTDDLDTLALMARVLAALDRCETG